MTKEKLLELLKTDKEIRDVIFEIAFSEEENVNKSREDINALMVIIQQITGRPAVSGAKSRQYAYNFLRKLKKEYPTSDPLQLSQRVLQIAVHLPDEYHSVKCHDPKHLFYNWQEIVARGQKIELSTTGHNYGMK